jgi:hypothetical protein
MNNYFILLRIGFFIILIHTCNAFAKDSTPLKGWEFVAVISKDINASVSIIVLKDDSNQFEKEEFMKVLRERFKNMDPLGNTDWVYSMKFTNGKRREIIKKVNSEFFKDIERHFAPLAKPSKLP